MENNGTTTETASFSSVVDNKGEGLGEEARHSKKSHSFKDKFKGISNEAEENAKRLKRRSSQVLGFTKKSSKSGESVGTSFRTPSDDSFLNLASGLLQTGEEERAKQSSGEAPNETTEVDFAAEALPPGAGQLSLDSPSFLSPDGKHAPLPTVLATNAQCETNGTIPQWPPGKRAFPPLSSVRDLSSVRESPRPKGTEKVNNALGGFSALPKGSVQPVDLQRDEEELNHMDPVAAETYLGFVGLHCSLLKIAEDVETIKKEVIELKNSNKGTQKTHPHKLQAEMETCVTLLQEAHKERVSQLEAELRAVRQTNQELTTMLAEKDRRTSSSSSHPRHATNDESVQRLRMWNRMVLAQGIVDSTTKKK